MDGYSKAFVTIHNVLKLEMDVRELDWAQIYRKISMLAVICPSLKLRKYPNSRVWMMRVGGRWIYHTRVEVK